MNAKQILNDWGDECETTDYKNFEYSEIEVLDIIQYVLNKSKPKGKHIKEREYDFVSKIQPFTDIYLIVMLDEFIDYWTEANDNGKKMRFEMAKNQPFSIKRRLNTWKKNSKKWDTDKPTSLANKMKKDFGL